jgi:hypothetical protein
MPGVDGDRHLTGPGVDRGLTGRPGMHPGGRLQLSLLGARVVFAAINVLLLTTADH